MIKQQKADLFIAGPAFNAGRYGVACGDICKAVSQELDIPVHGMYIENPGVTLYRRVLALSRRRFGCGHRNAFPLLAKAALKLARGEELKAPKTECGKGYPQKHVRTKGAPEGGGYAHCS